MAENVVLLLFIIIPATRCDQESCPASTQNSFQHTQEILAKPYFRDLWGFKLDWSTWQRAEKLKLVLLQQELEKQILLVEPLTETGYKIEWIPTSLRSLLNRTKITHNLESIECEESLPFPLSNCEPKNKDLKIPVATSKFLKLKFPVNQAIFFKDDVVEPLKVPLQDWLGTEVLETRNIVGIRYLSGAWIAPFVEAPYHQLCVMLQIGQSVEEEWPLTLIDHGKRKKKVYLRPGQMIMFESSRVPHGRQFPLKGEYYDVLLVFFQIFSLINCNGAFLAWLLPSHFLFSPLVRIVSILWLLV